MNWSLCSSRGAVEPCVAAQYLSTPPFAHRAHFKFTIRFWHSSTYIYQVHIRQSHIAISTPTASNHTETRTYFDSEFYMSAFNIQYVIIICYVTPYIISSTHYIYICRNVWNSRNHSIRSPYDHNNIYLC